MTIYLVRHGQTIWNAERRYQGHMDSPLTHAGQVAVERTAALMKRDIRQTVAGYVSPLGRTMATASIIERYLEAAFQVDHRLVEVTMGSWDGLRHTELANMLGQGEGAREDWYFRSPDGERLEGAVARTRHWWERASRPAIVVTHALISQLIVGLHLNLATQKLLSIPISQEGYYKLDSNGVAFVDR